MREVVSVQVGTYANFVGAHFWNFQDELAGLDRSSPEGRYADGIDADVLFNVGETRQGFPTYTPRLLVYDVKGRLGSVRAVGSLYDEAPVADISTVATWSGPKRVYQSEAVQKSKFRQCLENEGEEEAADTITSAPEQQGNQTENAALALEGEVRYWTDYLKAHLHPSSVTEIASDGIEREDGSSASYGEGRGLVGGEEAAEERREGLRQAAEACDHLQGFQCSVDESGGFTALGADILREMCDEYGRVPRLVMGLRSEGAVVGSEALLTDAVSFSSLSSLADLYVPMGGYTNGNGALFPQLRFDPSSAFHTSALCASAVDTMTMPYRLMPGGAMDGQEGPRGAVDMSSLVRMLARTPQTCVASAAMALPVASITGEMQRGLVSMTKGVGVGYGLGSAPLAESYVLRGGGAEGLQSSAPVAEAYDSLQRDILSQRYGLCVRHLTVSRQPLPIPLSFPRIFTIPTLSPGAILHHSNPSRGLKPEKVGSDVVAVPVMTTLATGPQLLNLFRFKISAMKAHGVRRGAPGAAILVDWGFAREDTEEMVEQLEELVQGALGNFEEDME